MSEPNSCVSCYDLTEAARRVIKMDIDYPKSKPWGIFPCYKCNGWRVMGYLPPEITKI